MRRKPIGIMQLVYLALIAVTTTRGWAADEAPALDRQIDLETLGTIAVYSDGRVKSFDSFARSMMQYVSGPRDVMEQPATFTYLDLMLRPARYADADLIFVKNKSMRANLAKALGQSEGVASRHARLQERLDRFMDEGLISQELLLEAPAQALLERESTDVRTTAKLVEAIETAMVVREPIVLRENLRIVPPPAGQGVDAPWRTIDSLAHETHMPAGMPNAPSPATLTEVEQGAVDAWTDLSEAWRQADAAAVDEAITRLATTLPQINQGEGVYPASTRLAWESWYFASHNLVWVWIIYAFAVVPLLLSVVFRWPGARWAGLTIFLIAFAMHTFAILLRWYVADRWPNSNMFEAITTSAWLGGCVAIVMEVIVRRLPMRGLFALASSVASMTALMAAHFLPLQLNPGISNRMPVLHDVWIYIHTNVIILSYCLIALASVTALTYVLYRVFGGSKDYARVGGAGSLIMKGPEGEPYLERARTSLGQVLDGTTMVLLELSFVSLWAGIVMGAIWADHSWGRPWGWDPKEVFALNTFLVFLVLVHIRLKVRDKGIWTAGLALVGCGVMIFNWIVINFTIAGLHSYA